MEHSIDREKVIEGLKKIIDDDWMWKHAMYYASLISDALDLLKEQEPAMPTWRQGKAYCGKCGQRLPRKTADRKINYCGYCGQAVKWE